MADGPCPRCAAMIPRGKEQVMCHVLDPEGLNRKMQSRFSKTSRCWKRRVQKGSRGEGQGAICKQGPRVAMLLLQCRSVVLECCGKLRNVHVCTVCTCITVSYFQSRATTQCHIVKIVGEWWATASCMEGREGVQRQAWSYLRTLPAPYRLPSRRCYRVSALPLPFAGCRS